MESEVCQDLFSKGDYKVMITDEDGTSEAKVKSNVNADIEKWSDKIMSCASWVKCYMMLRKWILILITIE